MKIFKSSLIVLAAAAVIIGFAKLPRHSVSAEAQVSSVPVVGIQAAEGSGSGGCTRNLTNVAYSSNPSDYAGAPSYDGNPYGNTDCARITLSGTGPFTQDFRIGVRMQNPKAGGGWGPWGWTSWASEIANGTAPGWSPWVGAIVNTGSDPGHAMYQVSVDTQALPDAGDTISISSVGLQEGDGNTNSNAPYYCDQGPSGEGDQVYSYGGGWSTGGRPVNAPAGFSGVGDLADCSRVYLGSASILGARPIANTVPIRFNASEATTTGSDGSALSITMKNVGTVPWTPTFTSTDKNGTQSGNCTLAYDSSNGVLNAPASGSKASSCSVTTDLTSTDYFLVHTASKFSISPEKIPISYTGVTKTISYTPAYTVTVQIPCGGAIKNDNNSIFAFIKTVFAATKCTEIRDVPESWDVSYGVAGSIAPGQNFVFPMTSLTAPAATGTYKESWQMQNAGNPFGASFSTNMTVVQSAVIPPTTSGTGTITVTSENAAVESPVDASWWVGGASYPCSGASCPTSTGATYSNLDLGNYILGNEKPANPAWYSFKGVTKENSIAKTGHSAIGNLFALSKDMLLGVAEAKSIYGCMGADLSQCGKPDSLISSLTILSDPNHVLDQGNFLISWDPIPAMSVTTSPSPINLDPSGTTSGTATITNTGAPGSALVWTANTTYTSGEPTGWLTPETGGGTITNSKDQTGSSDNTNTVTFGLSSNLPTATGTYTANVEFVGTSPHCVNGQCGSQSSTITLAIGGGGGGCPGCPPPSSGPSVSISPSSNTITLGQSQKLTISSTHADSCTGSGDWSGTEPCNGTVTVTPNASGTFTYTIKATNSYGSASDVSTIIVQDSNGCPGSSCNPSGSKPSCTLKASPTAVVVPGSSTLTYSCVNVSSCSMSGGGFGTSSIVSVSGTTAKGTTTDAPTTNTFYTINCNGTGSYSTATATANVQVTVTNPGRSETSTF
jgi:hypothetical protein